MEIKETIVGEKKEVIDPALFYKAHEAVCKLADKFEKGIDFYLSADYSESEVRSEFIDDFFRALGWDVGHNYTIDPRKREVRVEKTQLQKGSKSQKYADYAFYAPPNYKDISFFVEAKRPSKDLENIDHYFQTIRYGWNANTPVAVLTDFEEFHILDCRYEADPRYVMDGAHQKFHFTDYRDLKKFEVIYWLFSREAVLENSLQDYSDALPKAKSKARQKKLFKGGYQSIDDSFLEYLDGVRYSLAKSFKKHDNSLSSEQLTEAVQRTVDRLVFIRFLEDKEIEPSDHLSSYRSWKNFIADCKLLKGKYNGVVFNEHGIDGADFKGADDESFLRICEDMSSQNSKYLFSLIPVHILGSIYEQFLGKVIRATPTTAKVEEKPEVRKAGGVYYTPKYIVDYIVENTVGKIIEGLKPIEIATKTFADIACGSGSFLLGVYDYLLDYHRLYYAQKLKDKTTLSESSKDYGKVAYRDNEWKLSLSLKQEILLNNIYGVDIDAQAVEVTQLSLFLKLLEDETLSSTTATQGRMFSKVLPDLTNNIVCGNSLIGFDIMDGQLFDNEQLKKLNPLDYQSAFPPIMRNGGFDAIVGNPPYVRPSVLSEEERTYLFNKYEADNDLYSMFIEKCIFELSNKALLGYIVPSLFIKGVAYKDLRAMINTYASEFELIERGDGVFKDVQMPTCTFILKKTIKKNNTDYFQNSNIKFFTKNSNVNLGEVTFIRRGLEIGRKKIFAEGFKKCITGSHMSSYHIKEPSYISKATFYSFKKDLSIFESPKLLVRETGKTFVTSIDNDNVLTSRSLYNVQATGDYTVFLLQGILSSRLFNFYFKTFIAPDTNVFPKIRIVQLKEIPLPKIYDKNKVNDIETLVAKLLTAKQTLATAATEQEENLYQRQCESLERQIDELVYELYELTPEEIKIVEGV